MPWNVSTNAPNRMESLMRDQKEKWIVYFTYVCRRKQFKGVIKIWEWSLLMDSTVQSDAHYPIFEIPSDTSTTTKMYKTFEAVGIRWVIDNILWIDRVVLPSNTIKIKLQNFNLIDCTYPKKSLLAKHSIKPQNQM
jgi:hypothetical protein